MTPLYTSMDEMKTYIGCNCSNEDKHGETSVMCCNHCGLPVEEFWAGKKGSSEVELITLTPEELNAAIYEGKKKKFFHEKNKHCWPQQDAYEGKEIKNMKI